MEPSPAPHESPGKAEADKVKPGSLSRFKALAAGLFGVDQEEFREERLKDEEERRARRGRSRSTVGDGSGSDGNRGGKS
jgi:hypothetical protein